MDSLEFLLRSDFLSLELLLILFNEVLLDLQELQIPFKLLQFLVLVLEIFDNGGVGNWLFDLHL